MSLYSMRSIHTGWRIVKFDNDLNVQSEYEMECVWPANVKCSCPQANKNKECRHRDIWATFINADRVNKGWFYDYDNDQWLPPLEEIVIETPPIEINTSFGKLIRRI